MLLGGATLISQVLGLVRDRLLAGTFGASTTLDIYYAAFRIPDLIFISVGSLMAVTVLVPLLVQFSEEGNGETLSRFLSSVLTVFSASLILFAILAYFAMPHLASYVAPGFGEKELAVLVGLSRLLLLSPLLLGLSNLFGSLLQARHRFLAYAIAPILYNVGIIVGIVLFYPMFGIYGLAGGVILGASMHLAVQFFGCRIGGQNIKVVGFTMSVDWKATGLVFSRSLPRAIAMGANQLALIFLIAYASKLSEGSIAIFNLSFNLQSVPMALIGVSYSVASFPTMVKKLAEKEPSVFVTYIHRVMGNVVFFSLPVVALFVVLRKEIVMTVLGTGSFGGVAISTTASALAIFSIAVVFQNIILLLDRSYYGKGISSVPVITNIVGAITTIGVGYFLFNVYHSVLVLPLAFLFGVLANMASEWFCFRRDFGAIWKGSRALILGESVIFAIVVGAVAGEVLDRVSSLYPATSSLGAFTNGGVAGVVGILVGVLVLKVIGSKQLSSIINSKS